MQGKREQKASKTQMRSKNEEELRGGIGSNHQVVHNIVLHDKIRRL